MNDWRAYQDPPQPVVYRVYDKTGRLIYIGSTRSIPGRFHIHEQQSWWYELIDAITTVDYPAMEAARAAEIVAIQEEQPAFNVAHTTNGPVLTAQDAEVARRRIRDMRCSRTFALLDALRRAAAVPTASAA